MTDGRLDPAGRRELARLISEDGLSPRKAAARLGVSEEHARQWIARWFAADEAAQRFAAFASDEPRPIVATSPPPVSAPRRGLPRRQLAGVAMVLAFVPIGWVASAALFGDDDAGQTGAQATGPDGRSPTKFTPSAARAKRAKYTSLAAHVKGDSVTLHSKPGKGGKTTKLPERKLGGKTLPLVMLVTDRKPGWLKVQLPIRPNHATAWIRKDTSVVRSNSWRLRIDLSKHQVVTWRGKRLISRHKIGVGRAVTPTPKGLYYLTDLIKPPNPNGLYGSYAFGLSAHSKVLTSFGAGDGQIGLHGTNAPDKLGTDVSHGCIRVEDSVIESFARHLPLGTPVVIAA